MLSVGKSMAALMPTSESDPSRTPRRLGCDISRGGSLTPLCRSISPVRVDDDIALGHSMDMTPYFRDRENARLTGRGDPGDLTAHGFADLVLDPEESEMSLQGRFVVGVGGRGGSGRRSSVPMRACTIQPRTSECKLFVRTVLTLTTKDRHRSIHRAGTPTAAGP